MKRPHLRKDLDQWFTDAPLATRIVTELCDVRGRVVVEPSAGDGVFVDALLAAGALAVWAVEIDPAWARWLRSKYRRDTRVQVVNGSFFDFHTEADEVVGNPPYKSGLDGRFLEHGLRVAPHVTFLLRLASLAGAERHGRVWSHAFPEQQVQFIDRPDFEGEKPSESKRRRDRRGLGDTGPRHEYCVSRVRERRAGRDEVTRMQWWRST